MDQVIKMENRVCKCGCNQMFKCAETSGQRYFAKSHLNYNNKSKDKKATKLRAAKKNTSKPIPRSRIVHLFESKSNV